MYKNKYNINFGFTLVELLIVVSLIGILAGVVIAVINPNVSREKTKNAVRMNNISKVGAALSFYYTEKATFPPLIVSSFQDFVNSYLESSIITNVTLGASYLEFVIPPDTSIEPGRYRYYANFTDQSIPIIRVIYVADRGNINTSSGLCWAPDKNGGKVFAFDTNYTANCIN